MRRLVTFVLNCLGRTLLLLTVILLLVPAVPFALLFMLGKARHPSHRSPSRPRLVE